MVSGYLKETGWIESYLNKNPQTLDNLPLPWVTYSYIDFIVNRLDKNIKLFEFGSGSSTRFYSSRVNSVYSVEHDKAWYNKVIQNLPDNVKLEYRKLERGGEYSKSAKNKVPFDIVIVDGRDRVNCVINSIDSLSTKGVVILDDSERSEYKYAYDFLVKNGFKFIDFTGISPGCFNKKCTTIFYRNGNCLGI